MKSLALIALALLAAGCRKSENCKAENEQVIVLAGQSNMRRFSEFGGEHAFAQAYGKATGNGNVRFINCSQGSTVISDWQPNGYLMNRCISMAQGLAVTAVIFYQGENDALAVGQGTHWENSFRGTMGGFTGAFGPNIKSFVVQLAVVEPGYLSEPGWQDIKDAQARSTFVSMVKSDDLGLNEEGAHMVPEFYPALGTRLGETFSRVKATECSESRSFLGIKL